MRLPAKMAMRPRVDEGADTSRKIGLQVVHFLCITLLLLASFSSFNLSGNMTLRVPVFLTLVYVSALGSPKLCPLWIAFVGGVAVDFAAEGPIGVHAILFVAIAQFVAARRALILNREFAGVWFGYWAAAFIVAFAPWFLLSALERTFFSPVPAIISAGLNGIAFPILFRPLFVLGTRLDENAPQGLNTIE